MLEKILAGGGILVAFICVLIMIMIAITTPVTILAFVALGIGMFGVACLNEEE